MDKQNEEINQPINLDADDSGSSSEREEDQSGVVDLISHLITELPREYVIGTAKMLHAAGYRKQ